MEPSIITRLPIALNFRLLDQQLSSNNGPADQQLQSPFITQLPGEIRNIIYELYVLAYMYDLIGLPVYVGWDPKPDKLRVGMREAPLVKTCRIIAQELRPIVARYGLLRPQVSWEQELLHSFGNMPMDLWKTEPARVCWPGVYGPSLLRHLHLHIRETSQKDFRVNMMIFPDTMACDALDGIETLQITVQSDYMRSQPDRYLDGEVRLRTLEHVLWGTTLDTLHLILSGERDDMAPVRLLWLNLKSIGFVGIFHRKWLDEVQDLFGSVNIKILRGRSYDLLEDVMEDQGQCDNEENDIVTEDQDDGEEQGYNKGSDVEIVSDDEEEEVEDFEEESEYEDEQDEEGHEDHDMEDSCEGVALEICP